MRIGNNLTPVFLHFLIQKMKMHLHKDWKYLETSKKILSDLKKELPIIKNLISDKFTSQSIRP